MHLLLNLLGNRLNYRRINIQYLIGRQRLPTLHHLLLQVLLNLLVDELFDKRCLIELIKSIIVICLLICRCHQALSATAREQIRDLLSFAVDLAVIHSL